ncbi:hypothetical protein [Novosphingobium rosa]|uniref:hypothetical protein n=1 Tax=Novosphingobium rosa TaxID=76978 RepID=UPI0008365FEC|nr:hypothetical protein [Novosphingobium rosa]
MPFHPKRHERLAALMIAGGLWCLPLAALAQVSSASDADIQDAPPQFKSSLSNGRIKPDASELTRQNIQGAPPSKDPRDFNGMYNFLRDPGGPPGTPAGGGKPGGPGGPAGGGGKPGGPGGPPGGGKPTNLGAGACVVTGFGALTSYSTTVLMNPREVMFLMEENHVLRWATFADRHRPDAKPSYTGDSIARWDGDTLVIDTTQVATRGKPGTDHYVEKATKLPDGNIAIQRFKADDSGTLQPVEKITLRWRPDLHYVEDICEDFGEAFGIGYQ